MVETGLSGSGAAGRAESFEDDLRRGVLDSMDTGAFDGLFEDDEGRPVSGMGWRSGRTSRRRVRRNASGPNRAPGAGVSSIRWRKGSITAAPITYISTWR